MRSMHLWSKTSRDGQENLSAGKLVNVGPINLPSAVVVHVYQLVGHGKCHILGGISVILADHDLIALCIKEAVQSGLTGLADERLRNIDFASSSFEMYQHEPHKIRFLCGFLGPFHALHPLLAFWEIAGD
eukprot:m.55545 g.55545  ORF g.55545 m.55545 type:complete len:130 (-) comp48885_c0_seq8:109-498(-)